MRVLIVQSNLHLGELWKRHLERLDADVTHVQTGEQALHLTKSPDLTLSFLIWCSARAARWPSRTLPSSASPTRMWSL